MPFSILYPFPFPMRFSVYRAFTVPFPFPRQFPPCISFLHSHAFFPLPFYFSSLTRFPSPMLLYFSSFMRFPSPMLFFFSHAFTPSHAIFPPHAVCPLLCQFPFPMSVSLSYTIFPLSCQFPFPALLSPSLGIFTLSLYFLPPFSFSSLPPPPPFSPFSRIFISSRISARCRHSYCDLGGNSFQMHFISEDDNRGRAFSLNGEPPLPRVNKNIIPIKRKSRIPQEVGNLL